MKSENKRTKKIVLTAIAVLFVIIIAFAITIGMHVSKLMKPTSGEDITKYDNPKTALLVVDVQNDTVNNPGYKKTETLMSNINTAISTAKENDYDIIYIKQEYSNNPLDFMISFGNYQANSEGAELSNQLLAEPEIVFSKNRADTFSSADFEQYLIENQIDTLYIVGADASACVYKTACGGINRGYAVTILEDAVFAASDDKLQKMIKSYEEGGIEVRGVSYFVN